MLATIYAEIVKNLEVSKTALMQETPTVEVIDHPELPLKKNKRAFMLSIALGFIITSVTTGIIIVNKRQF
jgi:uncharacterized protein involved in exopolysaccharide biosynthesis